MIPKGAPVPPMPGLAGTIMGFFHATPEFSTRAAPLAEQAIRGVDVQGQQRLAERLRASGVTENSDLSKDDVAAKIRDIIKDDPDAQRLAALHRTIAELALELKDDKGATVPTGAIVIQAFPPRLPGMLAMPLDKMREKIKEEMKRAGLEVADLMLVAQPPTAPH